MSEMFCFQCQQTAGGSGCVKTGVCGKQPETAHLQDALVCRLIRLAEVCQGAAGIPAGGHAAAGGRPFHHADQREL